MTELTTYWQNFWDLVGRVYTPSARIYWLYIVLSIALATLVYIRAARGKQSASVRGFLAYLFPRSVWLSRSALVDYRLVAIQLPVWVAVVSPVLLSSATVGQNVSAWIQASASFTPTALTPLQAGLLYTLIIFLVEDFRTFLVHRAFHKIDFLWEFHKVHHSAEALTPITQYRHHPVYLLVQGLTTAIVLGTVTAVFTVWYQGTLSVFTVLGINVANYLFNMLGSNLRHSHIWLHWGSILGRIFISPAQHQIHHSDQPRHYDKNFGVMLAIWDLAFGSLYLPRGRESFSLGLPDEKTRWYDSAIGLWLAPFSNAYARISERWIKSPVLNG